MPVLLCVSKELPKQIHISVGSESGETNVLISPGPIPEPWESLQVCLGRGQQDGRAVPGAYNIFMPAPRKKAQ